MPPWSGKAQCSNWHATELNDCDFLLQPMLRLKTHSKMSCKVIHVVMHRLVYYSMIVHYDAAVEHSSWSSVDMLQADFAMCMQQWSLPIHW